MTAMKLNKLAMVAGTAVILAAQTFAQSAPNRGPQQQVHVAGMENRVIVVSLEDRKLALVENGQVKKVYSVAVGKPSTPSPVGTFTIERRAVNPTYHHGGKTIPPGPGNPVGTRWMGLSIHGYGIHGTNEPKSTRLNWWVSATRRRRNCLATGKIRQICSWPRPQRPHRQRHRYRLPHRIRSPPRLRSWWLLSKGVWK